MRARFSVATALAVAVFMSVAAMASASAHEFITNKAGVALKTEAVKTQKFIAHSVVVECKNVKVLEGKSANSSELEATVEYEECLVSGTNAVENIRAEYTIYANETAKIRKAITIKTLTAGLCTIKVPEQGPLSTLKYVNVTDKGGNEAIELQPEIAKNQV